MTIFLAFMFLIGNLFASDNAQKLKEDVKKLEAEFEVAGKKLEDAVEALNKASGNDNDSAADSTDDSVTDPEESLQEDDLNNQDNNSSEQTSSRLEYKIDQIKQELDELKSQVSELNGNQNNEFSTDDQYHQSIVLYNHADSKEKPIKEDFIKAKESFFLVYQQTKDQILKAKCAFYLGKICKKLADKEKAIEYFKVAFENCSESNKIEISLCLAEIFFDSKDPLLKSKIEELKKMQLNEKQKNRLSKIIK